MSIPKILAEFIRFTEIKASLTSYTIDGTVAEYRFALLTMRSDLADMFRMFFEPFAGPTMDMSIVNRPVTNYEIVIKIETVLFPILEMVKMPDYGRRINNGEHWEYDDEIELDYALVIE
jgi:hypothetical protein